MKIYISADIEGVTGVTNWNETEKNLPDWIPYARQMSLEVLAAIEGALEAGATEITIKDAHDSARNLDIDIFPDFVKVIRGWSGDPLSMITNIDNSYDAILFIGYHSGGGTDFNPLSHTMNASNVSFVKINDTLADEFILHAYSAALFNVPVVFVSGDKGLTDRINTINKNIKTVAVKEGIGGATISISPKKALSEIKNTVKTALTGDIQMCNLDLPEQFKVEIGYKNHVIAKRLSYYPTATLLSPNIIGFETDNFYEVMRLIHFLT